MKPAKKDIRMLLLLLGAMVFFFAYFLATRPMTMQIDLQEEENAALRAETALLRNYAANLENYQEAAADFAAAARAAQARYPQSVETEDLILYVDAMEIDLGIAWPSAAFTEAAPITEFDAYTTYDADAGTETLPTHFTAGSRELSGGINTDYETFKSLLRYLADTEHKTMLKEATLRYNPASAGVSGNVVIRKAYVTEDGYAYAPEDPPGGTYGVENLFQTRGTEQ
jgi:hypothetical protein